MISWLSAFFLNPTAFLTGAAAASAPVIIHLLNRRRFRVRDWAAMRFLLESLRKNRRRLRLEELLLLLLRTLAVVLLALALGRFTGCTEAMGQLGAEASRTVVFVLDDSYSMGQTQGENSLLEQARADLVSEIRDLRRSDNVAILLTSRYAGQEALFGPAALTEPEAIIEEIRALQPSHLRTALNGALDRAAAILRNETGNRVLYVFSDFRRVDLVDRERGRRLGEAFEGFRRDGVRTRVIDYGRGPRRNLTVESLSLLSPYVVAGREVEFEAVVRNNGPEAVSGETLAIEVIRRDEQETRTRVPAEALPVIDPGGTAAVRFKQRFAEPGNVVVEVALPTDELALDDKAALALEVRPAVDVLVVDGGDKRNPNPSLWESGALADVLDPEQDQRNGFRCTIRTPTDLESTDLDRFDLAIFVNVPELPSIRNESDELVYPRLLDLEDFVASGGGLAIFTGDKVVKSFYNGPFHKEGAGLNPLPIHEPRRANKYFRLAPDSIEDHPVNTAMAGGLSQVAALLKFFTITPADEAAPRAPAEAHVEVLARYEDAFDANAKRYPAVVTKPFGDGKVVVFYTAASSSPHMWNDFDKTDSLYTITLIETANYLARRRRTALSARLPAPIEHELPARLETAEASLTRFPSADLGTVKAQRRAEEVLHLLREAKPQASGRVAALLDETIGTFAGALQEVDAAPPPADRRRLSEAVARVKAAVEEMKDLPGGTLDPIRRLLSRPTASLLRHELRFNEVRWAGVYGLHLDADAEKLASLGMRPTILLTRNPDPVEGRLDPAGESLVRQTFGDVGLYAARGSASSRDGIAEPPEEKEFWIWALGAMVALMAVETFLGQKFGHYGRSDRRAG